MDPRERKEVLGQWGVRAPTERELDEGRRAAADLEGSPLRGRRLELRRSSFRPAVDTYVLSRGGPLPYMQRLREIERLTEEAEVELGDRWRALAEACGGDGQAFARRWRAAAARVDFQAVNELIATHNRWYPVEARLPMDPRKRDYVLVGGRPYTREPLDAAWVLERFPADLEAAAAARRA